MSNEWFILIILSELLVAATLAVTVDFQNLFQKEIGFSLESLGYFAALAQVGTAGFILLNKKMQNFMTLKKLVLIQSFSAGILLAIIAMVQSKWIIMICFIFITIVIWGFGAIRTSLYFQCSPDQKFNATFLSINNLIQKIFAAGLVFYAGYLFDIFSYQKTFGIFAIILTGIVCITIFTKTKK